MGNGNAVRHPDPERKPRIRFKGENHSLHMKDGARGEATKDGVKFEPVPGRFMPEKKS